MRSVRRSTRPLALHRLMHVSRPRQVRPDRRPWRSTAVLTGTPLLALVLAGSVMAQPASATQTVLLGTAAPFAVLGASAVTNVPTSVITGNVGLSPAAGSFYTGISQAQVTGSIYATDATGPGNSINNPALLTTAQNDLTTAYTTAANLPPTSTFTAGDNQLGGQTLTAGVYAFSGASTANITASSPLVLDGQGDPNAVFVFQASSTLVTASGSSVQLINGAQACNVFWQVSSSATLGSSSNFVGTIMALASATLNNAVTVQGRILARTAAVTLNHDTITVPPTCAAASTPTTTTTTTSTPTGTTATTTPTGTGGKGTAKGTGTGGKGASTGSITTAGSVGSGEGSTGSGSAAGVNGTSAVVPVGAPHTGFGGAAHSPDKGLIGLGALAVAVPAGYLALTGRRRHGRRSEAVTRSS